MAKARVYELAKELGVESKAVMAKLRELGEFVRSASSTVEPPVVRKLRDAFRSEPSEAAPSATPAPKPGAPRAATKKQPPAEVVEVAPAQSAVAQAPVAPTPGAEIVEVIEPGSTIPEPVAPQRPKPGPKPTPRPAPSATPASQPRARGGRPGGRDGGRSGGPGGRDGGRSGGPGGGRPIGGRPGGRDGGRSGGPGGGGRTGGREGAGRSGGREGSPRPGNNPFAPQQGMPRGAGGREGSPRPGNNPFAPQQGMPRGAGGPAGPRPGGSAGPRPSPGMMPGRSRPGGGAGQGQGNGPGRSGAGRGGSTGAGQGQGAGPGRSGGGRTGGPGRGSGGRGSTQGAFGRGGGKAARGRKSKRAKRQEFEQMDAPSLGGVVVPRGNGQTVVRLRRGASLADFAERINANPAALVTVLFHLGEMATATQSLDEGTFEVLGGELGYVIEMVSAEEEDRELLGTFDIDLDAEDAEDSDHYQARPPVVTVMGHVDHGKTKLLDAIRSTNVVAGEAGGITQHIGAYQVVVKHEDSERALTFIDTPGHEAFTAMRARGAQVTDIAILVVAADDGVMPQTIEAINHAQAADVPIVVAVNKVDKEGAKPDKIRQQLTEYNLVAEEYGGSTMFVDISALKRTGIDDLLEAVLLTSDAELEPRANPDKDARGVAIEANLDRGRGPVATVLVQSGTLRVGDSIVAGTAYGRARAMFNDKGEPVKEVTPSFPAQVIGLTSVPRAGDTFLVAPDDRTARQIAEKRAASERAAQLAKRRKRVTLEDFTKALEQGKVETLNLVIKGDVSGAVEALEDALLKITVGEEVDLRIIHRGVGAITQNDVNLATVDNAIILGFNVKPAERVADLADREGVDIRYYSVIYQALDDVEAALRGMLKPEFEEVQLGTAEIREVFRSSKFGNIAGSLVRSGEIRRGAKARVIRAGVVVGDNLSIGSLRRFKDDVVEVRDGYECGIGLGTFNNLSEGDIIETFEMREKERR